MDRSVASVGRGVEQVAWEGGVLVEDEDNLVAVEPPEPLAGVNGAERTPELE